MAEPTSKARASRASPRPPLGKRPRPAAAKTTPPRLGPHYRSSRLYRLLDQARRRPIVWISAPAGAGKTTLITSYLEARGLSCLWYQLDERDADPASFFSSLRAAVRKRSPRKRETLQFLTPEYVFGLPAYTRNFFEKVGMRFATPFALVLDNYQDLPEHALLQRLLPQGLASLPDDFSVFVLSRIAPPAAMAGEQARRRLARVESEALQLNEKEVQGIAKLYKLDELSADTLTDIQTRTQGWVAGVVLLLEGLSVEAQRTVGVFAGEEEGVVFDYFATELFDKADARTRAFLLKTALLPQVNAELARDVTGEPRSAEILAELARKNTRL
jgi:ATP/maltotriose-dependent transcriptional regulator MalT